MTTLDSVAVMEAFWQLTARHLPLRFGYDDVFVSPEAARWLDRDVVLRTQIDPRLHGTEMRLQRRSRRPRS